MFSFYGKRKAKQGPGAERPAGGQGDAPGIALAFDPYVIKNLKHDHQEQMQCAVIILASAREARFERTRAALSRLRWCLQAHLDKENLHLYAYLAYCLKDDPQRMPVLSGVRQEMVDIGHKVMRLLQHYDDSGVDSDNVNKFLQEFDEILGLLATRNDCEENSLFPLYLYPGVVMASHAALLVH
ncbi:MAG: hemerythrin domain-containing protein [Gammaproteobacteria bacterium]